MESITWLLVNDKWIRYTGSTSTRKIYYRAHEAKRVGAATFYMYGFTRDQRVTGMYTTYDLTKELKCSVLDGVPVEELPRHIVLDKKEKKVSKKPANPKQAFGDKKPDLRLLPLSGQLAQWEAHKDGANKYGPFNWRENSVEANTYINAAKRHLELFAAGEERARDTGVSNLGAVMACCAILIDAAAHNMLLDNRHKSQKDCDLLHEAEAMVLSLRKAQEAREKNKPVIKNGWTLISNEKHRPNFIGYDFVEYKYSPTGNSFLCIRSGQEAVNWQKVYCWRPTDGE